MNSFKCFSYLGHWKTWNASLIWDKERLEILLLYWSLNSLKCFSYLGHWKAWKCFSYLGHWTPWNASLIWVTERLEILLFGSMHSLNVSLILVTEKLKMFLISGKLKRLKCLSVSVNNFKCFSYLGHWIASNGAVIWVIEKLQMLFFS